MFLGNKLVTHGVKHIPHCVIYVANEPSLQLHLAEILLIWPREGETLPIFNIRAPDGAIQAGAAAVGAVAKVEGIISPEELDKEVS